MELPLTYRSQAHPAIAFSRQCTECELGKNCAVGGAGPDRLSEIKLIVVSDHPGHYEQECGYPFFDNAEQRRPRYNRKTGQTSLEGWKNAGALLRDQLGQQFGLDTYRHCWLTNAVKCDPGKNKIKDKNAKTCALKWFCQEMAILDEAAPEVPILFAGSYAYKAIAYIDKELSLKLGTSLRAHRLTNHWRWRAHPLVFTYNPAAVAKSEPRIETEIGLTLNQTYKVNKVQPLPPLVGSPQWMFARDLEMLRPFL